MKLSVVVPCFNEAATIQALIARVSAVAIDKEIIVVDDYSTDGTRKVLASLAATANLTVLLHDRNRGKGAALFRPFARSSRTIQIAGTFHGNV